MAKGYFSIAHVCLARGYSHAHRQTELLIKALGALGPFQYLICRDDSPLTKRLKVLKSNIKIIKVHGIVDPRFSCHFKLMRKATIVHAHDQHGANWALVHNVMFGVPYVLNVRGRDKYDDTLFNKTLFNWASAVITTQTLTNEMLKNDFHVQAKTIKECTDNLVPYKPNVDGLREAYKGRYLIGMVGDLINRLYGQTTLLEAYELIKTKLPHAVIFFIGTGDDMALLRDKARELPNVKFLGRPKHMVDYIAALDLFVYPVNYEGNTSILLDVLDQSVPIIASNVGSISDIIVNEETGILVRPKDPEALADAIMRVKGDEGLVRHMVANGAAMAHSRESPYMASEYLSVYRQSLNN
ncbi:Glycogen synthase [Anaerobiospirillum thomasii]|uniref:glycosyltransferase family 4 protein n=1 Tax=Anaerobiospirillum thomasii TaxID=179995 RepID=UPI000D9890A6|nr:glycosyltransferase family 4 protein [Anaerobiospirillum thomasii]SPT71203.1 Glycogen synthase [Anaerobiospirillum thomasii]